MPTYIQGSSAGADIGLPLGNLSDSVGSNLETQKILEENKQTQREMQYADLKLRKAKNEITNQEYIAGIEAIKNSTTVPADQIKWDLTFNNEKRTAFIDDLGIEDKRIQLKYTVDEDGSSASQAYTALADKAQAAGETEVALGYMLKAAAAGARGSSGSGGGGYSSSGTGYTKEDKASAARDYEGLLTQLKNSGSELSNNFGDIKKIATEQKWDDAKLETAKAEFLRQYTSDIYGLFQSDAYKNYFKVATPAQTNEAFKVGTSYASLLTKYDPDKNVLNSLSQATGEDSNDLQRFLSTDIFNEHNPDYFGMNKEDITFNGTEAMNQPDIWSEMENKYQASMQPEAVEKEIRQPGSFLAGTNQETQRQSNPLGNIFNGAKSLLQKGKSWLGGLF
ncbi:hypothetical protein M0R04_12200 [Candidatus Dojkabacteria bacterium]|jgi:hypothetical protein|nr:hypothetical protein [Candidatus Dojkabacteria bacterium]